MEHYDDYAQYTRDHDWEAICAINKTEFAFVGARKELKALPDYLEPDEVVFALTFGAMKQTETSNAFDFGVNTWLVVLTSDRFLFLDAAMLTKSIDTQSIRHEKVQAVSASQGLMLGKIMVDLGSRVLTIDNSPKATVKVVADLANKWLKELDQKKTAAGHPPQASSLDQLEKLASLHKAGALSDDEFSEAKQRLLSAL